MLHFAIHKKEVFLLNFLIRKNQIDRHKKITMSI